MSDDNELTPEIEAALRDIPAADPALRDQHIAAALGEIAPAATMKRRNLFAAAAAVLVLAGAGFAVSQNSDGDTPAVAAPDTTVTSVPKASGDCAAEFSGLWGDSAGRGQFSWAETDYTVIGHNGGLSVYLAMEPCTAVGDISYWEAMDERDKDTSISGEAVCSFSTEPISRFEDRANGNAYKLALVKTDTGVSLFFEDRCNEPLGSIALPTSGD